MSLIEHFWPRANPSNTLFVKNQDGRLAMLSGRRASKLRSELLAGRGGPEVTALTMSGYIGFLDENGQISDFEALRPEHIK